MSRFVTVSCVLATYLAYTLAGGDMGGAGAAGGGGGEVNCAEQQSCPKPGGGCVPLGDVFKLNECTDLTCTNENNVYGLRGDAKCSFSGSCYEEGEKKTFSGCGYTCKTGSIIGFVKDDPACGAK